jgi:prepilin-type N-terminal cleavage/methylation domain-containing protein
MKVTMKNQNQKKEGFTLIELMTVIAIFGIMVSVVLISFNPIKNQNKLKAVQTEMVSTIKQAQSYALQGKAIPGVGTPKGYGFEFFSNQQYRIFYCMSEAECANASLDASHVVTDFSTADRGVTLTVPADFTTTRFYFDIPNGNRLPESFGDAAGNFKMTLSLSGTTRDITISKSGSIIEQN